MVRHVEEERAVVFAVDDDAAADSVTGVGVLARAFAKRPGVLDNTAIASEQAFGKHVVPSDGNHDFGKARVLLDSGLHFGAGGETRGDRVRCVAAEEAHLCADHENRCDSIADAGREEPSVLDFIL